MITDRSHLLFLVSGMNQAKKNSPAENRETAIALQLTQTVVNLLLSALEKSLVTRALAAAQGNKSKAADILGFTGASFTRSFGSTVLRQKSARPA